MIKEKYFDNLMKIDRSKFNCGGLALNTPKWVVPYIREDNFFTGIHYELCRSCPHFHKCDTSFDDDSADGIIFFNLGDCARIGQSPVKLAIERIEERIKLSDKIMGSRNLSTILKDLNVPYTLLNRNYIALSLIQKYPKEKVLDVIANLDAGFLLSDYPFLKICKHKDSKEVKHLIAYKIFITFDDQKTKIIDSDFHFKIRINKLWYEKSGAGAIFSTVNSKKWKNGGYVYDSKTIYLVDTRYEKLIEDKN